MILLKREFKIIATIVPTIKERHPYKNKSAIKFTKPCGRKSASKSKRKYPVCRPKAVASRMTAGQKSAAVKRKKRRRIFRL